MVTYVLAMAFILVYGGEHFAFDILTGWLYAIAVTAGFALATRLRLASMLATWWARVRPPPIVKAPAPPPAPVGGGALVVRSTSDEPGLPNDQHLVKPIGDA